MIVYSDDEEGRGIAPKVLCCGPVRMRRRRAVEHVVIGAGCLSLRCDDWAAEYT
jgi:hypothetical protein